MRVQLFFVPGLLQVVLQLLLSLPPALPDDAHLLRRGRSVGVLVPAVLVLVAGSVLAHTEIVPPDSGIGKAWMLHLPDDSPQELGEELEMVDDPTDLVSVRYMVDDVEAAIAFYTKHLGFTVRSSAAPAFADVTRGPLRLLLSGPKSSAGRPMPDGAVPSPGGWNRIHLIVPDIAAEVDRLRAEGVPFRNDIVKGPGGQQILLEDPAGNVVELFQPAGKP